MSFFKKFKDKFTVPSAQVSIQLDKPNFVFGEDIQGQLSISSTEEFDAKEIRCEFQCIETRKKSTPK